MKLSTFVNSPPSELYKNGRTDVQILILGSRNKEIIAVRGDKRKQFPSGVRKQTLCVWSLTDTSRDRPQGRERQSRGE